MFTCVTCRPSSGHVAFGDARDAEVENLQPPVLIHHQIGRLDVAVNDAGLVRVRQPRAQLRHQLQLLRHRQRRPPLDLLRERLAPDVLHHDERRALELAGVVDVDDVGVVQRGQRPGFAGEALAEIARIEGRVQQLEGDETVGVGIVSRARYRSPIPPRADEALDLVAADSGRQRAS